MKYIILFIYSCVILFFFSCEKEESGEQKNIVSTITSSSHNFGENCMNCHKSSGSGDGWFIVAGSVYNSTFTGAYITATIEIRTEQSGGGTLVSSLPVDQDGNFYTTYPVDFGNGMYVSVVGGTSTRYMSAKATTGACNSCHDASNKLWGE